MCVGIFDMIIQFYHLSTNHIATLLINNNKNNNSKMSNFVAPNSWFNWIFLLRSGCLLRRRRRRRICFALHLPLFISLLSFFVFFAGCLCVYPYNTILWLVKSSNRNETKRNDKLLNNAMRMNETEWNRRWLLRKRSCLSHKRYVS